MLQDLFELVGKIRVDTTGLDSALKNAKSQVEGVGKSFSDVGKKMSDVGGTMTKKVTTPIVAAGAMALHSATSFESAFAGVRKTVDATEEKFGEFKKTILDMSTELPATANEIAGVFEMGGQLGIANKSLESFSRTIIDIGESTDLSLEMAATSFARFANITEMSQNDFDRLGSVVVALGNSMATTESEIVGMSMRLAAQGKQVGMSEDQIMALSATMSSLGINAEAGGTSMTTILKKINAAVGAGGADLESFAKIAGVTSEEFAQLFKDDAVQGLDLLVGGLRKVSDEGGNVAEALEGLGMKGIYESDTMMRLVGSHGLLGDALQTASKGWKKNTALSAEAEERYKTTESQLKMLKNEVIATAIQFGEIMIPILLDLVRAVKPVVEWFGNLSDGSQKTILFIGALVAVIGPLLMMLGSMLTGIGAIVKVIALLGGGVGKTIGLFARLGSMFGGVGKVIGTLTGAVSKGAGIFARFLPMIGRFATMIPRLFNPIGLAITAFLVVWNLLMKAFGTTTGEAIKALIGFIVDGAKWIGNALLNLGEAIVSGLGLLLESAVNLFISFIEWMATKIGEFVEFTAKIWNAIIEAIINFIVEGIKLVVSFVNQVIEWFTNLYNRAKEIVGKLVTAVLNGFSKMVSGAIQAAKDIVKAIVGGFQKAWNGALGFVKKAATLGVDFAKGIAKGIKNGAKFLKDAVVGIGKAALSSFKDFFKIKSPSRVMENEAKWLPAGIAGGIVKGVGKVGKAMGVVGDVAKRGYKNAMEGLSKLSVPSMANILPTPRRVEFAGVPQEETVRRRSGGNPDGGTVNVHVRKLEDVSSKKIQNKVQRRFFTKARQRE